MDRRRAVRDIGCSSFVTRPEQEDAFTPCWQLFPPVGGEPAMLWLAVLTLPDGSRVESNLLGVESADTGLAARAYRLRLKDGSITEFSTLTEILRHLVDHYEPDDLSRTAASHEVLTADLAAATSVDLASILSTAVEG